MLVVYVVGARPNFIKISPMMRAMKRRGSFESVLVHTGQHYDDNMSKNFFRDLELPEPDLHLGVGSGSQAWQTAEIMNRFEKVLAELNPDLVLVVGDVNSTLACSLVAAKRGIPVTHIEAGLRSFDRTMPEEINRLVTDQLSDYLFTTCVEANDNLRREGIGEEKIFFVGNVMVDSLLVNLEQAKQSGILNRLSMEREKYIVVTLHRPSNVDNRETLGNILHGLNTIQQEAPVIFPAHPRTLKQIKEFGLSGQIAEMTDLHLIEPLGYLDFLSLMSQSKLVLTDSGGIQEETTVLGIPCLTLRENTERPVTVTEGTNTIVGSDPNRIVDEAMKVLDGHGKVGRIPKLWDGKASERIVAILEKEVLRKDKRYLLEKR